VDPPNLDATALLSAASSAVSMPWAEVGELRVDASGGRSPRLLVADARGKEWTVALDPAGIAGVQATLDAVDGKLPSSLPVTAGAPGTARVAVGVVCAALLIAFQWTSALVVVALTLLKPNPQALIATGVATGAAALIAASQATSSARLLLDVLPVAAGAWVLWLAWRWHRAGGPADRLVHVLTGLAAIATWIAVLMYARLDPFLLHVVARRTHALVVLPLAMAAAWMWSAEARFRRGAFAWLALAAIAVGVASTTWLNTIVRDPLLSRGPELQPVRARLVPVATSEVDLSASELWLSPGGRSFAVAPEPPEEDERPLPFTVGTTGGALAIVDAYAIRLVDEDTLVTLERDGEVLSIKARPVTATRETTWSVRITGEPWGDLSVDPATRRWRFEQPGDPGLRIFTGVIGSDRVEDRTVATDAPRIGYVQWFATDAAPIGHSHDYEQPTTMQAMATALLELPWRLPLALRFPNGGTVRSHFDGRCYGGRPGLPVTCVARDGTRSHFWMWDGHEWRPAGSIAGDYVPQDRDASGWLAGWSRGRLLLVDPLSAQALEIGGTCQGDECLTTATYTGRVLGGLMSSAGHVAVSTYRVEPLTPR
jgi:hypothetical protein